MKDCGTENDLVRGRAAVFLWVVPAALMLAGVFVEPAVRTMI